MGFGGSLLGEHGGRGGERGLRPSESHGDPCQISLAVPAGEALGSRIHSIARPGAQGIRDWLYQTWEAITWGAAVSAGDDACVQYELHVLLGPIRGQAAYRFLQAGRRTDRGQRPPPFHIE